MTRQPDKSPAISLTHGDYFLLARAFLENNEFEVLSTAAARSSGQAARLQDIEVIRIGLVKHGEFYHPACIEAGGYAKPLRFVLNMAISKTGRDFIKNEYQTLQMLVTEYPVTYVPHVYAYGEIPLKSGRIIPMFLGQWLDGYHEFHISADPSDQSGNIKVWDSEKGDFFLTRRQMLDLYANIAGILTHYYHLESMRQVFPWHHAAGDFIAKIEHGSVDVKLITVRRYAPLMKDSEDTAAGENGLEQILQALLVFFINLSIRMRVDRLDGVGDMVWSDEIAVSGMVNGFFDALALKPQILAFPAPSDLCFKAYLSSCSKADLFDLAVAITDTFDPKMPESYLVQTHLRDHVDTLYAAVARVLKEYTI